MPNKKSQPTKKKKKPKQNLKKKPAHVVQFQALINLCDFFLILPQK